ncbi:MAG: two-component system OmpR family response regulator [Loktanella salsilacus]|jgi:two-component system OmpR family response regulator|uniref:winged helix-turn-helix domain-containing protein n=1 Tax=Loktanella salsilacus TaxID=195913 RepID=UPI0020B7C8F9|nr:response regulator transcription factor [Loktanella salsilacus]UTH45066.1 response regulator transcription factor [Loktanella salsilacus]
MKILVIEDDAATGAYIADGLREEGHSVDLIASGADGLVQATIGTYDVMVVDRMLPGLDGMSVVKTLRATKNATPVLFLTAMGGVDDRIAGLHAGADDYLVKPFAFGELSARIAAIGRRPKMQDDPISLTVADLDINLLTRKVTRAGQIIDLLPREFALLEQLMRRKGRVQTRTMLMESVWDIHYDPLTNVVDTHISRLRAKIDKPFGSELIETVRGAGYRINVA